jgi:cystathionine gamma-synthase
MAPARRVPYIRGHTEAADTTRENAMPNHRFGTLAIHAGQHPEETTGAIMPPIFQTSTYVQPKLGEPKGGYEYARVQNPTREAMEANIAGARGRQRTAWRSPAAWRPSAPSCSGCPPATT